jgi:sulfur dioxygenase
MNLIFRQLYDNLSSTYTYLISSGHGREAIIIDPVIENVNRYIKLLDELDLKLVKVIDTHVHADHISGIAELREKFNCITIMGEHTKADIASMKISDGEEVSIEGIKLKAIYTPGHTDDSYSYIMNDRVFTGDTLLIRGTGRTDFQNGNAKDSYNSIFKKLLTLPEETLVYPAHDYKGDMVSTIGEEKKFNPRLQVKSIDEYVEIMNNLNLPNPKMMDVAVPGNLKLGVDFSKQKSNNGLTPLEFKKVLENEQVILIDLREEIEIKKEGKIPKSINVPFQKFSKFLSEGKADGNKLLIYCAIGERSNLAVQTSKSYKDKNVFHLVGGLKNWKNNSLSVEN